MKKTLVLLLTACLILSGCSKNTSQAEKIEEKNIDEYTSELKTEGEKAVEKVEVTEATEGYPAPDVTVKLYDGTEKKLSDYYGKPLVINFWATWCGYCILEMPAFQMVEDNYGDKVEVLLLNCGDTLEDAKEYMDNSEYTFDSAMIGLADSMLYADDGIPVTVIIDSEGVVQFYKLGGGIPEDIYEKELVPMLDELLEEE